MYYHCFWYAVCMYCIMHYIRLRTPVESVQKSFYPMYWCCPHQWRCFVQITENCYIFLKSKPKAFSHCHECWKHVNMCSSSFHYCSLVPNCLWLPHEIFWTTLLSQSFLFVSSFSSFFFFYFCIWLKSFGTFWVLFLL